MKYYILKEACATNETGPVYPQIQKWKPGYNGDKENSFYTYLEKSKKDFADFAPDLDGLVMHGRAKPTDLVSAFTSGGFLMSEKLKMLFEKHKIVPHRFYPARIIHKGNYIGTYFWMHIISDLTDFVDYANSTFVISKISGLNAVPITLNDKRDYLTKSELFKRDFFENNGPLLTIDAKKLKLNDQFDKSVGGFKVGWFDINFYINQVLRDEIIENHITGCDIKPTGNIVI